jgi:hypothetical protein
MAGTIYSGTYTSTILLTNPVQQNPVTLTGSILVNGTNASSDSGFYSAINALWSITNLGHITAHGDTSYGIALLYGGAIQNGSASNTLAAIVSDETGILLTGQVSSVVNNGTIQGTAGRGVFLQDGGTLSNARGASVIGGFEGVAIYNAGGSLTNAGTITDTGSAGLGVQLYAGVVNNQTGGVISGVYGVGFTARYTPGTLTNAGLITGSARDGVELSSGGTVTNSGQIAGGVAGVLALYGATGINNTATIGGTYAGVDLLAGGNVTNSAAGRISGGFGISFGNGDTPGAAGTVTNSGVISGGTYQGVSLNQGGGVVNSGSIYGRAAGVAAFYGAANVSNTGSIASSFIGVDLAAGGSLTNAAHAQISGSYGILLAGASAGLTNAGTIAGSGRFGADLLTGGAFVNQAGGTLSGGRYGAYIESVAGTIANYGVITGQVGIYSRAVVASGTRFPAAITIINAGTITGADGVAVSMFASNDLLIDRPGAVFNGGVNSGGGRLELAAGTLAGQIGTIGVVAADIVGFSTVTVDSGATWTMGGTLSAGDTLVDHGTLLLRSGGTLTSDGLIEGPGILALSLNGGLVSGGTLSASATIAFDDPYGHLALLTPLADFAPTTGFSAGDTIYLPDTPLTGLSETFIPGAGAQGTLTLNQGGSIVGAVTLDGHYTTGSFSLKADPNGGSDVVIPCFLTGTRIAVAEGERRVERLRAGDWVLTAAGALRQIVWMGHRSVDIAGHLEPDSVQPVRIRAGAFGSGLPRRDLLLSPDHAVFHQGALIPVHLLVNNRGVQRQDLAFARYWHIELASHDVLLAEGLAVESYRETGMGGLQGAPRQRSVQPLCAPLALNGPMVARVRRHLAVQQGIASPRPAAPSAHLSTMA